MWSWYAPKKLRSLHIRYVRFGWLVTECTEALPPSEWVKDDRYEGKSGDNSFSMERYCMLLQSVSLFCSKKWLTLISTTVQSLQPSMILASIVLTSRCCKSSTACAKSPSNRRNQAFLRSDVKSWPGIQMKERRFSSRTSTTCDCLSRTQ